MMNILRRFCCAAVAGAFVIPSAHAQTDAPSSEPEPPGLRSLAASNTAALHVGISTFYSAVAAGNVNFGSAKGNSGAQTADVHVATSFPLHDQWSLLVGASSHNIFLGGVPGAPVPQSIYTLSLTPGIGYHLNDQWTFAAGVGPRFYRVDSTDSQSIGIGGQVGATYICRPNLAFSFGLGVNPDRDIPVLPGGGLRWNFAQQFTLNLMFPRAEIDYRPGSKLTLFAGFASEFTIFRAGENLGDKIGLSQFNSGLGTYRDFHAAVGADYRIMGDLFASLEGGYSFDRQIDYDRIGQTVRFGSAPYVQVGLKFKF
jgi:opacity protein-like surface antigen